MDTYGFLSDRLSRRRFLHLSGAGAAGGSAALLAACGDGGSGPAVAPGPDESDQADIEILNGVLDLELRAIAAYKTGAAQLRGSALEVVKRFLAQEQEHADGLSQAIEDAGGRPNEPKASYDFPQLHSQRDVLRFAVELENTAIAAYIDALPKFSENDLRATASAIITNEAEHLALLLDALGRDPAPDAFVTGRPA